LLQYFIKFLLARLFKQFDVYLESTTLLASKN